MDELIRLDILVIWPIRISLPPLPRFIYRLIDRIFPPQRAPVAQPNGSDDPRTSELTYQGRDPTRRLHFTLGLETAPVIGVLLLLASTCIPGSVIADGIVGSEGVRPYDIMTLFLSFVSLYQGHPLPLCCLTTAPELLLADGCSDRGFQRRCRFICRC